jgi:hypothetical protein
MQDELEQKLDAIIAFIRNEDWVSVAQWMKPTDKLFLNDLMRNINVNAVDFAELMEIMVKEDFVQVRYYSQDPANIGAMFVGTCRLKYQGKIFANEGGYVGRRTREREASRIAARNESLLANGTTYLWKGTVALALIEIARLLLEHPPHFCQ